jgi:LCP family protein required for cell wall assembly
MVAIGTASCLLLGVAAAGASYVAYRRLNGNITSEDISAKLGDRPAEHVYRDGSADGTGDRNGSPLNILLIGSDTRAGDNGEFGPGIKGARSDTTILLHISADRERAYGVSIPRDSVIDIPACDLGDGRMSAPRRSRFNAAFSIGGTACTVKTVEQNTNVRVDHFVVVDFTGFTRMVDALGGVEVCLPEPVRDKQAKLDLPAGRQEVGGQDALGFVRARKALGDGSDLSRIKRQQAFLSAVAQQATSSGLLFNPRRLFSFLDAATKSITTDPELADLNELRKLAQSVQDIGLKNVKFVTVPVVDRGDGATVAWKPGAADALWAAIGNDAPLPGEQGATARKRAGTDPADPADPTGSAETKAAARGSVKVTPSQVRVRVLNGSGVPGVATEAAADLAALGFQIVDVGLADTFTFDRSVVRHGSGFRGSARTLSTAVPGSVQEADADLGRTVELIVGRDYSGVRPIQVGGAEKPTVPPTPTATPTIPGRTADKDICS